MAGARDDLSSCCVELGRIIGQGNSAAQDAIAECLAAGNLIFNPVSSLELVGAYFRAGDVETGLALVTELLANIERTGERQREATLRCVRGQLLLARNATRTRLKRLCRWLSLLRVASASSLESSLRLRIWFGCGDTGQTRSCTGVARTDLWLVL